MKHLTTISILHLFVLLSCQNNKAENERDSEINTGTPKEREDSLKSSSIEMKDQKSETYKIASAESQGQSLGATCEVLIKGDSVYVFDDGSISGEKGKGALIDKGIIRKHILTGNTIITHDSKDVHAEEIGGCTDGPIIIDLKKKIVWLC